MKTWRGIGLMSGTSLDGIDLAFCKFSQENDRWSFELLTGETIPLDEKWVSRLIHLDQVDARTYARTHVYWGHHLGKVVSDFIKRHAIKPQYVASHGQTIFHEPDRNYTAQIGDGETMVSYLNCPLVSNLRNKDVAMGGQGAPLVPFGERMLWPDVRWFLNLGGIANLSRISKIGDSMAYDVGAINMALNSLTRMLEPPLPYDPDGQIAASGSLDTDLMAALEALPYYQQSPPKSLGTEWFDANVLPLLRNDAITVPDRLHTYVQHLAGRLAADLARHGAREESLLVTGGGAHNGFLMATLREALAPIGVEIVATSKTVIDFKEAIVFGFLGLMTLLGHPNTLSGVTGASQPVAGGSIHLPAAGGFSILS